MKTLIGALVAAALGLGAHEADTPRLDARPAGTIVTIDMVDRSPTEFVFSPARVTVKQGDTVRFRQKGVMPHNVEFRARPDGSQLEKIRVGPFLTAPGQTYDVVIDERFVAGEYRYVCTPHEAMGMKAVLIVEDASASTPDH